jgi:hypothetical protein
MRRVFAGIGEFHRIFLRPEPAGENLISLLSPARISFGAQQMAVPPLLE